MGGNAEINCSHCQDGVVYLRKCPNSLLDKNAMRTVYAYVQLRQNHVWPVQGGQMDQSATFIQVLPELNRLWYEEQKRQQKKAN